jgi:hypothetical protein
LVVCWTIDEGPGDSDDRGTWFIFPSGQGTASIEPQLIFGVEMEVQFASTKSDADIRVP